MSKKLAPLVWERPIEIEGVGYLGEQSIRFFQKWRNYFLRINSKGSLPSGLGIQPSTVLRFASSG